MSDNTTLGNILTLEGLGLNSSSSQYSAFIICVVMYTMILTFNSMVLLTIVASKSLHKPMFILLCNLPISDIIGASAFFPHLAFSIVTKNRLILYNTCMFQAFLIHFYGTANLLILSAMAYDRYVAICSPLRYSAIMTPRTLINTVITLSAHRIKSASPFMRRSMGVSVVVFPPFFDPIIYGLNTRELKNAFLMLLKRKELKHF
ncbi:hypothetical protein WMY93_029513 [Mugilogobius chulae]|uniref:G-protein coupled receptors family 1 profile domain-containing protein n=1 Tax=Mugilogobius chulae TaxID=88201 RepID=A0AAW0N0F3_9GOBI